MKESSRSAGRRSRGASRSRQLSTRLDGVDRTLVGLPKAEAAQVTLSVCDNTRNTSDSGVSSSSSDDRGQRCQQEEKRREHRLKEHCWSYRPVFQEGLQVS